MATTTNYSWSTPDDTALVKDGAAAIRTLGSSADTTVKALNPGTTAGDIDYYTTSTAKARVGIGTAGQVLTVNSGATAPEWATISAGGMTSLASGSLSSTATTISSISASYKNLVIVVRDFYSSTTSGLSLRLNGNSTSNVYGSWYIGMDSTTPVVNATSQTLIKTPLTRTTDENTFAYFEIFDYTNTMNKRGTLHTQTELVADSRNAQGGFFARITSAINSITITTEGGTATLSGGTYIIYGVN
jgi:hypothetical protein